MSSERNPNKLARHSKEIVDSLASSKPTVDVVVPASPFRIYLKGKRKLQVLPFYTRLFNFDHCAIEIKSKNGAFPLSRRRIRRRSGGIQMVKILHPKKVFGEDMWEVRLSKIKPFVNKHSCSEDFKNVLEVFDVPVFYEAIDDIPPPRTSSGKSDKKKSSVKTNDKTTIVAKMETTKEQPVQPHSDSGAVMEFLMGTQKWMKKLSFEQRLAIINENGGGMESTAAPENVDSRPAQDNTLGLDTKKASSSTSVVSIDNTQASQDRLDAKTPNNSLEPAQVPEEEIDYSVDDEISDDTV